MKNLIIIGARGFGRETYSFCQIDEKYRKDFIIKGFLDSKKDALDGFADYPPILNSVEDYEIQSNDLFICALGDPYYRKVYIEIIKRKGGLFYTLLSHKSVIFPNVEIGEGVTIFDFCFISANTKIGDFSVIHPFCNIGHDAVIGNYCALESYAFMGGYSQIGNNVTLHTRSTILPHVKVGDNAKVGAGSVVIRNVEPHITVFGMPAKKLDH